MSWYKASVTGQVLICPCSICSQDVLVEESVHSPVPGKKLGSNKAHSNTQGPLASDAEV